MDYTNYFKPVFDQLFAELGLAELPEDEKAELAKTLEETLKSSILTSLVLVIPDMSTEQMNNMSQEEFGNLLEKHNINPAQIAAEEAGEMREELLGAVAYANGYLDALAKQQQAGSTQTEDSA